MGPAGTDVTGWQVILYNGANGLSYSTVTLNGVLPDEAGSGMGTVVIDYPVNGIQNGAPDGMALVDAANSVVQFLSYEGTFTALNGPAVGRLSQDINVAETGDTPLNYSLQLTGTGSEYEDFSWNSPSENSFGRINPNQFFASAPPPPPPISKCGQPAVLISAIQGSGSDSPLLGSEQSIEAVVIGGFQDSNGLNGFFVQEEDSDADNDSKTSEGLFIASNLPVTVGDRVHIVGTVSERFNMTRLESVKSVDICAGALPLPAVTELSLPFDPDSNNPEWREGMLVNFPQTLTVTENFNLARFGEVMVSSGSRLMIPTQVADPGDAANAVKGQNLLNRLVIDDGSNRQNPDPVVYPGPNGLKADITLRIGDTVSDAIGVLAYDFSLFRLHPTEAPQFSSSNARPAPPVLPGIGSLKVASFNVLNYFNGDGLGGGFPTSRGANSLAEFNRQRDKIIAAIVDMDADIVGLMEIENDGYAPHSAIADLVDGLNAVAGAGTYEYIDPGVSRIGTDEIAVGIIFKSAKAEPVAASAILDNSVDPRFLDTKSRPVLAQTFLDKASNKTLTVAVNHFKSKGSSCDDVSDPDTGDGQGNCNLTRKAAALALADWLMTDPTGSNGANVMIIGDLNAYAKEDPIAALKTAGYVNLVDKVIGDSAAYSYVFSGESGVLDHALANSSLAKQVKGLAVWHINADEPRALDYNVEFKSAGQVTEFYSPDVFRSSDHDPLLVEVLVKGDLDNDGDVDNQDRVAFSRTLGQCEGKKNYNPEADYDRSGCVTNADYRSWYRHFKDYSVKVK
ncbi:MAG: ExeM/NucH family extracellular endonuclease [Methylicorpusculum sp.]|nr:ExeM/NucH family extracellular endonuclease [Methylicorpusculum sp.]